MAEWLECWTQVNFTRARGPGFDSWTDPPKKIARPQDSHVVTCPAGGPGKTRLTRPSIPSLAECSRASPREHRNSGLKTGGALVLHQSSPRHKGSGQRLLLRRRLMNCASLVRSSNTSGKPLSVPKGGLVR